MNPEVIKLSARRAVMNAVWKGELPVPAANRFLPIRYFSIRVVLRNALLTLRIRVANYAR